MSTNQQPSGSDVPSADGGDDDADLAIELIKGGSNAAGAAAGAAIGLVGGPVGVVVGAAAGEVAGRVLSKVGADLKRRFLGPSESRRIGAAMAHAGARIAERLKAGEEPRDDGFFDADGDGRSAAEELLEGVLLRARDAYEERRVELLGRLYGNLAFSDVDASTANHVINVAGTLTYRQLVMIGVAGRQQLAGEPVLFEGSAREVSTELTATAVSALTEAFGLYQAGLVSGGGQAWLGVSDVNPGKMRINGTGGVLFNLMELGSVEPEEYEVILADLLPFESGGSE